MSFSLIHQGNVVRQTQSGHYPEALLKAEAELGVWGRGCKFFRNQDDIIHLKSFRHY